MIHTKRPRPCSLMPMRHASMQMITAVARFLLKHFPA